MTDLRPVRLAGNQSQLEIEWSDGQTFRLSWRQLRDNCPCASCRAEDSSPEPEAAPLLPVLKPEETRPLVAQAMAPMGNYAYSIEFSDGHNTGIYTFETLRRICELTK